ncbi:MAG: NUDIX hydrolase [Actinomycetia bacterium]|nr:NUDIX hydrolase [Actinomycetes bacterium]
MTDDPAPEAVVAAQDAATVAVLRDGRRGLEALLLRRHDGAGFVPGAHVFPGGAVDPADRRAVHSVAGLDDRTASRLTGVDDGGLAFWVAAVRECLEESGVAPATSLAAQQRPADLSAWRKEVHGGTLGMDQLLESAGATIDASGIRSFARWVTPVWSPRRFDTRFFVTALPEGAVVEHDGAEIVSHVWIRPAEALDRMAAGEMTMIMPTVRTLAVLADHRDASTAVAGLEFGDPAEPLLPDMSESPDGRRLAVLDSDPERNGGVYDGETGMPLS